MSEPNSYRWRPIEDLPGDWGAALANPQTTALVQAWREQARDLRKKDLYQRFLGKLKRQWAVETGAIEDLYTISEGATRVLIEKGLDASLLAHEDTNHPPSEVIVKIQDQHHVIQGLYQFVSGDRPLGISYIKELHQAITAHQETYLARDTLGSSVVRTLPRGEWKKWPNNVEHFDGTVFEYCPPEHVAQEMEHLIAMHESHAESGVPPDVEAAWLHHRFSLIHPFTDGNGRIARCLATLVLLKENWLPLVVTRKERTEYIAALRAADQGGLSELVNLFGKLQTNSIREAFSLSEEVIQDDASIEGVLSAVKAKFEGRRAARSQQIEKATQTCNLLHVTAKAHLEQAAAKVNAMIAGAGDGYSAEALAAAMGDEKSKDYRRQISECALRLQYFPNMSRYQAWAALVVKTETQTEILLSFHGIGREESGILGCAAMAYTREKDATGESLIGPVTPLVAEPFEFAYSEDPGNVMRRFRVWLDRCVVAGLDYWQKSI